MVHHFISHQKNWFYCRLLYFNLKIRKQIALKICINLLPQSLPDDSIERIICWTLAQRFIKSNSWNLDWHVNNSNSNGNNNKKWFVCVKRQCLHHIICVQCKVSINNEFNMDRLDDSGCHIEDIAARERANEWCVAIIPCKSFLLNRMNNSWISWKSNRRKPERKKPNPAEFTIRTPKSINYPLDAPLELFNNDKVLRSIINFLINVLDKCIALQRAFQTILFNR